MVELKENTITNIEQTYDIIYLLCQENLYYPPNDYQESSQHILNASTLLYNDAVRLFHENILYGKRTHLSLGEIDTLLKKICHILNLPEIITEKELLIAEVLDNYNLSPENFLIKDEWNGNFEAEVLKNRI